MKRIIVAAIVLVTWAGAAHADPILTPLLATYITGSLVIGGTTVASYAAIASFVITTGASLFPSKLEKPE